MELWSRSSGDGAAVKKKKRWLLPPLKSLFTKLYTVSDLTRKMAHLD